MHVDRSLYMTMPHENESVVDARSKVSIAGVRRARDVISNHLLRTPLLRHPLLVEDIGCEVFVKHENHLPTGSFKVRGGLNYMANLSESVRERGVVTATRGNHGQSIAFAAQLREVRCVIVVPHGNNPEKNAAMRAYGAELIEHGNDFDEAREHAERLVGSEGLHSVQSADPHLINGVGTYSLEILEDLPDVDTIVVPVGGGSGICGAITVFRSLKPDVKIVGVQAEGAPSVYESWRTGEYVTTASADTIADGLATRVPFDLPLAIIREGVDEMLLVSDEQIQEMVATLLRTTHNVAEGAGAAACAAVKSYAEHFEGQTVAAILSGGNIDSGTLASCLMS